MHDLRRQALESNKTVSRKARSKQCSPATSRSNSATPSRSASRAVSRAGSDEDEGGNHSDETSFRYGKVSMAALLLCAPSVPYDKVKDSVNVTHSVNSIDEMLSADNVDQSTDAWRAELADRIQEIIDRKRSSVQGREKCLATYVQILIRSYAEEEIRGKEAELVSAFLKSIKTESSEKETVLAMKALALTLVTSPSDLIYDSVVTPLKRTISDSASIASKTAAVHALGTCAFYGGATDDDILDNMAYLLEIIASDGQFIEAPDEPDPVTAAIEEWGFLATLIDDLSEDSEEAIETIAEQLSSSSPQVQIAAGETIALLYEKSCKPLTDEDSIGDFGETVDILSDPDSIDPDAPKFAHVYTAYRRTDILIGTLSELAATSTHRLSKKDQKSLRTNFADILNSVEYPPRGPRYSNAISNVTGKPYGSRLAVRIHQDGVMHIDKWWKFHRLQGLRRVLQGGFVIHYENNPLVFESLPIMIENDIEHKKK